MHTGLKELLHVQTLDLKLAELAAQLARYPRRSRKQTRKWKPPAAS